MHTWHKVGCYCCFAGIALSATSATLQVDQARQRYPWNGLVDIDYTIACDGKVTPGVDDTLEVLMVDQSVHPAVTNRAITFLQAPLPMTEGSHRITWDANADGVTNRSDAAKFIVKIAHHSPMYMVIDVSGGASAETYPVDILNGAPPNGFNVNEYKGDKIVLRRIPAGSYVAGSPDAEKNRTASREKQHRVAFSQPFYIGLFEVTQKQYFNVMGTVPSEYLGDYRPVDSVNYNNVRGGNWPTTTEVGATTFMGRLLAKCKAKDENGNYSVPVTGFDLPTEFQWEYACRAGTTGAYNTTNEFANTDAGQAATLAQLGRYSGNVSDNYGGFASAHTTVGSYQPNAWGLYDMHGNLKEWCRDRYQDDASALAQYVDPIGAPAADRAYPVLRGGSWNQAAKECRSAWRENLAGQYGFPYMGFRLFCAE